MSLNNHLWYRPHPDSVTLFCTITGQSCYHINTLKTQPYCECLNDLKLKPKWRRTFLICLALLFQHFKYNCYLYLFIYLLLLFLVTYILYIVNWTSKLKEYFKTHLSNFSEGKKSFLCRYWVMCWEQKDVSFDENVRPTKGWIQDVPKMKVKQRKCSRLNHSAEISVQLYGFHTLVFMPSYVWSCS